MIFFFFSIEKVHYSGLFCLELYSRTSQARKGEGDDIPSPRQISRRFVHEIARVSPSLYPRHVRSINVRTGRLAAVDEIAPAVCVRFFVIKRSRKRNRFQTRTRSRQYTIFLNVRFRHEYNVPSRTRNRLPFKRADVAYYPVRHVWIKIFQQIFINSFCFFPKSRRI